MKRWWERLVSGESERATPSEKGRYAVFCLLFCLLRVISVPYHLISQLQLSRRQAKRSREWKAKVISIGNITVGGSGKTPITIYLADLLHRQGKKVAVIHSGYGRREKEEYIIEPGSTTNYTIAQIGDEVSMMREKLPFAGFAVGANKKQMVKLADRQLKPDIILIDDGFQRLDIEKDIDLVIISSHLLRQAAGEIRRTTCHPFPRGILRESISSLERANVLFVMKENENESDFDKILEAHNSAARVLPWTMSIAGVEIDGEIEDLSVLNGKRPYVFAAIGSFYRMLRMLNKRGITIAEKRNFGDHHTYTEKDFSRLKRWSDHYSADCYLTTAKDMVKLQPEVLDKPVYCLHLDLQPEDSAGLEQMIEMVVS